MPDSRFTDEFNGDSLDLEKWHDHHPWWRGRPPAQFVPSAISVTDGCLRIRAGVLSEPDGPYTLVKAGWTTGTPDSHPTADNPIDESQRVSETISAIPLKVRVGNPDTWRACNFRAIQSDDVNR